MRITVDADGFTTKHELHEALRAALGRENYFGSNLDALHDCLTSVSAPTVLEIKNWGSAIRHLGEYSRLLWTVLDDASGENENLSVILN